MIVLSWKLAQSWHTFCGKNHMVSETTNIHDTETMQGNPFDQGYVEGGENDPTQLWWSRENAMIG
jgi:hypothetical protein